MLHRPQPKRSLVITAFKDKILCVYATRSVLIKSVLCLTTTSNNVICRCGLKIYLKFNCLNKAKQLNVMKREVRNIYIRRILVYLMDEFFKLLLSDFTIAWLK